MDLSVYSHRESSFEAMRLIAQWMIIIYHILLVWFFNECPEPNLFFKAMWIPFHVAVPCYVIVSGYFGIKFSIRGLIRIIAIMFVYGCCLYFIKCFVVHDSVFSIRRALFFVSNTSQWFVRTYLLLFLLAPVINKMIRSLDPQNRMLVLLILAWMNCWCGFMGFEQNLHEGKNLVHFVFLYLIGNTLHTYSSKLNQIPMSKVVTALLIINIVSILSGYHITFTNNPNQYLLFNIFFSYNSILLVANAVLFFMLFMRLKFNSPIINYMATSSLAIYMLHMFLLRRGIEVVYWIRDGLDSAALQFVLVVMIAFATLIICIIIDKILSPCWALSAKVADRLTKTKIGEIAERYASL